MSLYWSARFHMSSISWLKKMGLGPSTPVWAVTGSTSWSWVMPALPWLGMTKACMIARCDFARSLAVWTVSAASASGSGLLVSGEVGTQESTVMVVAESRYSSFM